MGQCYNSNLPKDTDTLMTQTLDELLLTKIFHFIVYAVHNIE